MNNIMYKEDDWVIVYGKPYQIESLFFSSKKDSPDIVLLKGFKRIIPVSDIEKQLPNYELLLHRYNYLKKLAVDASSLLEQYALDNQDEYKRLVEVLENWE